MTVFRVPPDFPSISRAVASPLIKPGDTILVENGVYHEVVVVPSDKPGLRIVADGDGVILDGGETLATAFLIKANNVEINGFTILNYVVAAIRASRSTGTVFLTGTKLIGNTIIKVTEGNGIELLETFATLVWKNSVTDARHDGVAFLARDTWVVDNELSGNGENGLQTLTITTVGNMVLGNRIVANGRSGIADNAGLNLIRCNLLAGNRIAGIHELAGMGSAGIIDNTVSGNQGDGIHLDTGGNTVRGNEVCDNTLAGVRIDGDGNTVGENRITGNHASGVRIAPTATGNLVIRNAPADNTPFDINRLNPDNDLVESVCSTSNPPGLCTSSPRPSLDGLACPPVNRARFGPGRPDDLGQPPEEPATYPPAPRNTRPEDPQPAPVAGLDVKTTGAGPEAASPGQGVVRRRMAPAGSHLLPESRNNSSGSPGRWNK